MQVPKNTAIIGRIPGYNINIDKDGEFAHELLKGVTFIDLFPNTYSLATTLSAIKSINLNEIVKAMASSHGLFQSDTKTAIDIWKGVLQRLQQGMQLPSKFADVEQLRLIASNDSTFTETFSNVFGDNPMSGMIHTLENNKITELGKKAIGVTPSAMLNALQGANNKLNSNVSGTNLVSELATGGLLGLAVATPQAWQSSNYSGNLTMFIKLISPIGTPECIQKNILEPLIYLVAASSPITLNGAMYGIPLMWEVKAQGITSFKIGAINSLSLIRGSFETTFNYMLQPTVIDVRLNISPIIQDFAVQANGKSSNLYQADPGELSVQNPSDIQRGIINQSTDNASGDQILSIKL